VVSYLARDRALAMRTLMPRTYADRGATPPAELYRGLTRSGRAEVDRLVEAFQQVRSEAVRDLVEGLDRISTAVPAKPRHKSRQQ
jgi:hypothetical protein